MLYYYSFYLYLYSTLRKTLYFMKKQDLWFILIFIAIFLPFFVCPPVYECYISFSNAHAMIMCFLTFASLSTMLEMLGLIISSGVYNRNCFGIFPRMVVWCLFGLVITMAFFIFSAGLSNFIPFIVMLY